MFRKAGPPVSVYPLANDASLMHEVPLQPFFIGKPRPAPTVLYLCYSVIYRLFMNTVLHGAPPLAAELRAAARAPQRS